MKALGWIGSAKADLQAFPGDVVRTIGYALHVAQCGGKHSAAKPLRGYGGAGVLEIVSNHGRNSYRAVYTVRFDEILFVLHAFQKKAKSGIATPGKELTIVDARLGTAKEEYERWRTAGR